LLHSMYNSGVLARRELLAGAYREHVPIIDIYEAKYYLVGQNRRFSTTSRCISEI